MLGPGNGGGRKNPADERRQHKITADGGRRTADGGLDKRTGTDLAAKRPDTAWSPETWK